MAETVEIAREFHLHILHPACVEIGTLRERVAELEKELGRPFVMERGPWDASADGRSIASNDFTHDVVLTVTGDFRNDEERKQYAEEIARRLNLARAQS